MRRPLRRVAFLIPPTGAWCREDRCQSRFRFELIPTLRAPLEECEGAGAVVAAGGVATIIDAPAQRIGESEVRTRLRAFAPDLVVLSTTFGSLEADLQWAKLVREEHPGAEIAVRGAPAYNLSREVLLRAPEVDYCLRGDYEVVFEALVRCGGPGPGSIGRDELEGAPIGEPPRVDDLDSLPRPARTLIEPSLYRVRGLGVAQATVHVQRGCPYPCSYCLVHSVSGATARHRSPRSVAEEVAEVVASGVRYLYLRAETFSLDREWAIETSLRIAEKAPTARWVTTTRVDCADDELIGAMRRGGCYGISFGIDVASREIGERVRKRPNLERAQSAVGACNQHGVVSLGYFMLGFEWETPSTIRETAEFVRKIRPDLVTIHFAHPYPGTRYAEDVRAAGRKITSPNAQAEPALATASVSPAMLEREAQRIRRRHYRDPRVMRSLLKKGARLSLDRFFG